MGKMLENKILIYMHTAPNGKSYIGQTCNLKSRNRGHQTKTGCRAFYNAIQKYGWNNFEHKILADGLTLDEANALESKLIEQHNTLSPSGYNLRTGGENSLHSEETKARQSAVKQGSKHTPDAIKKISAASKAQTAETREKQRLSRIGKKRNEETKKRMSESMRGKKRSLEGCANIRAAKQNTSDETKKLISDSLKRRIVSAETRAKQSSARKGISRIFSEQALANISAAHKGKVVSEETRQKMSAAKKGRPAKNLGVPMSEDQKERMRETKKTTSDQTRARMSAANKAAWDARKARGTDKQSPETIAKRMASKKATLDGKKKKEAAKCDPFS